MLGQKSEKTKKNIFTKLAQSIKKHWLLNLIFVKLSAFWLPLLYTYGGIQLKLVVVNEQYYQLTQLGTTIMILCLIVVLIGNGVAFYDEKVNGGNLELEELKAELLEQKENGFVLQDLNKRSNSICDGKLKTLIDQVDKFITHPEEAPAVISDPSRQLDLLAQELSNCLAGFLKFQDRRNVVDLFTSVIYRFPQDADNSWRWATSERGLSIQDLLTKKDGKQSTFKYLLEKKGHSVFKNSKQIAYEKGIYVPDNEDEYDEKDNLKGSIACFQYEIKKNNRCIIEFVVTITSYAQQFVPEFYDRDEIVQNIKHNLEKVVLPNYMVRAKIELCLLYIKYLNEKNKDES